MISLSEFINEQLINEHFITLTNKDEMMKYAKTAYAYVQKAYEYIGGLSGCNSYQDFLDQYVLPEDEKLMWKGVTRDGKLTAVKIYKQKRGGRKSVVGATDSTDQGKQDLMMIEDEDQNNREGWTEMSGKALGNALRINNIERKNNKDTDFYALSVEQVKKLMPDKEIVPYEGNDYIYKRKLDGKWHWKVCRGNYKNGKKLSEKERAELKTIMKNLPEA